MIQQQTHSGIALEQERNPSFSSQEEQRAAQHQHHLNPKEEDENLEPKIEMKDQDLSSTKGKQGLQKEGNSTTLLLCNFASLQLQFGSPNLDHYLAHSDCSTTSRICLDSALKKHLVLKAKNLYKGNFSQEKIKEREHIK
ncbi:hypothetical protein PIB30_060532 [Stylosanthes scabra]|uniref:Uncharacterized protein n=1 Tax=Stylosanthes scabra TaxID=79078 RepID=A0ABU6XIJ6_9FABA|nr:hypothetical protein [Stylosanthes scabra]